MRPTARRDTLAQCRRIVVKVGTNTLLHKGRLHTPTARRLVAQLCQLKERKKEVVLVTSGAVGMGAPLLGVDSPIAETVTRQAAAAVGQPLLMHSYRRLFGRFRHPVAQVLMAREHFGNRRRYLNLRNTMEALLAAGVIPICNENDSVATDELDETFGDNDYLCALVASKLDAQVLILLTDTDALYTSDPRHHPSSHPLRVVEKIDAALLQQASPSSQSFSTGGMRAKLEAIQVATRAGCHALIAHGRAPAVITRILAGEEIGTLFPAVGRLSHRKRWMLVGASQGRIVIDSGALQALQDGKSLLPRGVHAVEGRFPARALVDVCLTDRPRACARLTTNLSSDQLTKIIGTRTTDAARILPGAPSLIARPDSIVFVE